MLHEKPVKYIKIYLGGMKRMFQKVYILQDDGAKYLATKYYKLWGFPQNNKRKNMLLSFLHNMTMLIDREQK